MTARRLVAGAAALAALSVLTAAAWPPSACASDGDYEVAIGPAGADLIDPPAAVGALAPNLTTVAGRLAATWLEPTTLASGVAGHRLRFARLENDGWSEPVSIVEGADFFANWADVPALVEAGDGTLYAHWLARTAADTYAYSVLLARSTDGGFSWQLMGKLNSDDTPTEHGFVTFVPEGQGARAFWLDGRGMVEDGPMALRSARVDDPNRSEDVVDRRVCECCGTDAAVTAAGAIVVYRDRSDGEVRDIYAARKLAAGWTPPVPVHADAWRIEGCPVNGPAIDARGTSGVAAAWFTAANGDPRVELAFSGDAGASFGEPIVVDASGAGDRVLGRVDVALASAGSAWVSWVAQTSDHAEIRVRRVADDGSMTASTVVAETTAARASGFPVLERVGDELFIAWVEVGAQGGASRIHVGKLWLAGFMSGC